MENADPYYTPKEAVAYLRERGFTRITVASLATMRNRGGGPLFHRKGRFIMYRRSDLDEWIVKQSSGPFHSNSDAGPYEQRDFDNGEMDLG